MCTFELIQPLVNQFENASRNFNDAAEYVKGNCLETANFALETAGLALESSGFVAELAYVGVCEFGNYLGRGVANFTNEHFSRQVAVIAQRAFDSLPVVITYHILPPIPNLLMVAGGIAIDRGQLLSNKAIKNITTGYAIATALEASKEAVLFGMTSNPKHIVVATICVIFSAYFFSRAQMVPEEPEPNDYINSALNYVSPLRDSYVFGEPNKTINNTPVIEIIDDETEVFVEEEEGAIFDDRARSPVFSSSQSSELQEQVSETVNSDSEEEGAIFDDGGELSQPEDV